MMLKFFVRASSPKKYFMFILIAFLFSVRFTIAINERVPLLKEMYSWPNVKPNVSPQMGGWFNNSIQLGRVLNKEMRLIVEIGSWLGLSTTFILNNAPNAVVVAIDHWKGSSEHQNGEFQSLLPILFETFLVNCWRYKERLIPLKMSSLEGLQVLFDYKLEPDLIYIDASHEYDDVFADLEKAYSLFPQTLITGDDWAWGSVHQAVLDFTHKHNLNVKGDDNFYVIVK